VDTKNKRDQFQKVFLKVLVPHFDNQSKKEVRRFQARKKRKQEPKNNQQLVTLLI
jgi:hypothetical protein